MKNTFLITAILLSILLPGTTQCNPNAKQPLRRKLVAARKSARLNRRDNTEIRGNISTQKASEQIFEFRIFFDGKETKSNSEGFFSFPIEENTESEYSLVICKKLQQNFEKGNTLQSVNLVPNKNYRHFTLKKDFLTRTWNTEEKLLKVKNFAIPKHSLVVLVDPKFVYSVQTWTSSYLIILSNYQKSP